MHARSATWTIVLRCYSCGTRFTLPHLSFDTITTLPLVAPCPWCGTQPVIRSKTVGGLAQQNARGARPHLWPAKSLSNGV